MSITPWISICAEQELTVDCGICALFRGEQVAIFRLDVPESKTLYAVSNYDPLGEAYVISRGIVGSIGDQLVVSSPLYKQHYCLRTGQCLEENVCLKTYSVRAHEGEIQLSHQ